MKTITIEGQLRTESGKKATRQIRSQDLVPGVIYGGEQEISFAAPSIAFKTLVYTPSFQIAEVKLEGATYRCIMKDLQFDKLTDKLIHIDLLELVEGKKVVATIPLHFTGVAKGVKEGGRLSIRMKALKIKTLPKYLLEQIEVNVDDLELNGNIRVEDVKVENFEILNPPRIPIASVNLTRELKQEEAAATTAVATDATAAPAAAVAAEPAAAAKGKGKK
jgi:large subunit ribosomal protein L25